MRLVKVLWKPWEWRRQHGNARTRYVLIIFSYLRMKVCFFFSHLVLNDCCVCILLDVYVCVNFGDEIFLRGEEYKTRVNLNFFEKWQNGKLLL